MGRCPYLDHIKLAYLPSLGRVRLRLSSKGFEESDTIKKEVDDPNGSSYMQLLLVDIAVGYRKRNELS